MNLDALVTASEFVTYMRLAGGDVSLAVVGMWRHRGLVEVRGYRGRSPLYRLEDLLAAEVSTRRRVRTAGGRARAA
jgi:hypothetical protein